MIKGLSFFFLIVKQIVLAQLPFYYILSNNLDRGIIASFLSKVLLLPAPLTADRALHVSGASFMHGKVGLPIGGYVSVMAFLTLIVSGLLLYTYSDKCKCKYDQHCKYDQYDPKSC